MDIFLTQRIEDDHIIDTIQKFRRKGTLQRFLHDTLGIIVVIRLIGSHKSDTTSEIFQLPASDIGSHDHNRIFKIDAPPQTIGQLAVIQQLQEDVEYIGMCFFNLIQ